MKPAEIEASVAVVILTVNQCATTLRALASLRDEIPESSGVLVWDNGSSDGTVDAIRRDFPEVIAHHHPENLGVASGRNAGAALAIEKLTPTHLLFLDNDMVVQPGFVTALLEPFANNERLGQTQAKLLYMHDPRRLNDGGGCRISFWLGRTRGIGCGEVDRGQYDATRPCISCGGAMMVRTEIFQKLGGFDPIFDPFGPEDIDFSLRLKKLGHEALYVPSAVAYHAVSHTFEGGAGYNPLYARAKAKHWLRFLQRHGSVMQKLGFALIGAPIIGLRMVGRELLRGNPGAVLGSMRGLLDAFRENRRNDRTGHDA